METPITYDCIIIGGGPAGMYGSIYLARFCRTVLLLDDGNSRAALIPRTHNYPGYPEGIKGTEILELLKKQIASYPIQSKVEFVTDIQRLDTGEFTVSSANADYRGKSILLASGIEDDCPVLCQDKAHILAGALHHCLVCDGFEVRNKKVIVFGYDTHAFEVAQGLLTYTTDIHVVSPDHKANLTRDEKAFLLSHQIKIYDGPCDSINFKDKKTIVKWKNGETLIADASYLGMGMKLKMPRTNNFNIKLNKEDRIEINKDQKTSVKGIFAAGDVCNNLGQITTAYGSAALAAREIHQYLKDFSETPPAANKSDPMASLRGA